MTEPKRRRRYVPQEPVDLAADRDPWQRQPGETEKAFGTFNHWLMCDSPRPPLRELSKTRGSSQATLTAWATKWRWRERASAWDRKLAEGVQAEIVGRASAGAVAVVDRQTEMADRLHRLADAEVQKLLARAEESDEPVLTPKTLLAVVQMSLAFDRVLTPDDDGKLDKRGMPDLTKLSVDELGEMRRLAMKTLID